MTRSRFNDAIEPMDLANMRQNGVRSLDVQCNQCRHRVIVNVDHLPGDLTVSSLGPRMVCTKCGTVGSRRAPELAGAARTGKPHREALAGQVSRSPKKQAPEPK
jgi:hypothetical protein